jgi:hypothetical protein
MDYAELKHAIVRKMFELHSFTFQDLMFAIRDLEGNWNSKKQIAADILESDLVTRTFDIYTMC